MKYLFFSLVAFSLLCLPASAAGARKIAPLPPESISVVTGVNVKTHEVTIRFKTTSYAAAKNLHTYTLDAISSITVNRVPGKFEDIRAGMQVLGITERDSHTLDNITLETAAPTAAK